MELTQESLEEAILKIKEHVRDRAEVMSARPSYIFIRCDLVKWADRLINPWKGKRIVWLTKKRQTTRRSK